MCEIRLIFANIIITIYVFFFILLLIYINDLLILLEKVFSYNIYLKHLLNNGNWRYFPIDY